MTKKLIPLLLLVAISLSSCGILFDKTKEAETPTAVMEATASGEATAETGSTDGSTAEATQEPLTDADNPCIQFNVLSLLLTTPYPGLPEVSADDYAVGPDDAILTFTVYTDPQCPYCSQLDPILDEFQLLYPNDVRVVTRLFPLPSIHDKSLLASQALIAAGLQGKFNELKSFLFERQYQDTNDPEQAKMDESEFWSGLAVADFETWLKERVPDLGINADKLVTDMNSDDAVAKAQEYQVNASALGLSGTPTLFINGYQWPENSRGIDIFTIYLKLLKNKDLELDTCPPTVTDTSKTYLATISTNQGDIVAELYPDKAPTAVNSFVYLAEQGWYDNLPIISSDEFVLSGDPTDTSYGGAGYAYLDEPNDLTFEQPGMLAAYSVWPGLGTNGSVFFINKTSRTDTNRTIFGKIVEGMDVLDKFTSRNNIFDPAVDKVLKITITEK